MALLTALPFETAAHVLSDYGLSLKELLPMSAGSVNSNFRFETLSGQHCFARIYEEQDQAGALSELNLVSELATLGLPIAPALKRNDGSLLHEVLGKPFAIYAWVEGEILCQARVTPAATLELGRTLARLHLATSSLSPLGSGRFGAEQLSSRLLLVRREGDPELAEAAAAIERELNELTTRRDPSLPCGVTHTDLFRDNVLWKKDAPGKKPEIAALIDFESAATGPFAYDLMVTLLAWCYQASFEHELGQALLDGYHEVRPLSAAELSALEVEGRFACLRFATTRMTDYSLRAPPGTPPGRDYRRFLQRKRAIEQGVLTPLVQRLR